MALKILADENIPQAERFFAEFGEVRRVRGRDIAPQLLKNTDILLVRSVTRVNADLLKNSSVKFVGSTTIGSDHIDLEYLQRAGITFAHAPGASANSVAEYVLSVILTFSKQHHFIPSDKTLGIIGYGNVGRRVKAIMDVIGVKCLVYDPPLELNSEDRSMCWSSFDEVLSADIISLHVPLTVEHAFPTYHMFNEAVIQRLQKDTIVINTSRGSVIDNHALKKSLIDSSRPVALDVWEGEPNIDIELLEKIQIATPHIAGYSVEGKLAGVQMVKKALSAFTGVLDTREVIKEEISGEIKIDDVDYWDGLRCAVDFAYDVRKDDRLLKVFFRGDLDMRLYFDRLRKEYWRRREFSSYRVNAVSKNILQDLRRMGFA